MADTRTIPPCQVPCSLTLPTGKTILTSPRRHQPGKDLRPSVGPGRPVLISGRFLTPAGRTALAQSYSWGMAIRADESTAVLLSRGAFQVISTAEPKAADRFPAFGQGTPKWLQDGTYMGCAFSPDSQKLDR